MTESTLPTPLNSAYKKYMNSEALRWILLTNTHSLKQLQVYFFDNGPIVYLAIKKSQITEGTI